MRNRTLKINKSEAEALLFHYHKNGIPPSQTAAKDLERRLCDFVEVETNDEYKPPCEVAHYEGTIKGEQSFKMRLKELRRANEVIGDGDRDIVNAVRLIEEHWDL